MKKGMKGQIDDFEESAAVQGLDEAERAIIYQKAAAKRIIKEEEISEDMKSFGGFCILLAVIGIGNVFSNTLGFVHQRRREFARYMSVGLTPGELGKMFCIEALVVAGRPVLISLPPVILTVGFLLKTSYMEAGSFLAEAPLIPIFLFMSAILGSVASAYYLAWRNVRKIKCNLSIKSRIDTLIV